MLTPRTDLEAYLNGMVKSLSTGILKVKGWPSHFKSFQVIPKVSQGSR